MKICGATSSPFNGEEFQLECTLSATDPHHFHHFQSRDDKDESIVYTILWRSDNG